MEFSPLHTLRNAALPPLLSRFTRTPHTSAFAGNLQAVATSHGKGTLNTAGSLLGRETRRFTRGTQARRCLSHTALRNRKRDESLTIGRG